MYFGVLPDFFGVEITQTIERLIFLDLRAKEGGDKNEYRQKKKPANYFSGGLIDEIG